MNAVSICTCGHRRITHRYLLATRDNTGECLAPECGCRAEHDEEEE